MKLEFNLILLTLLLSQSACERANAKVSKKSKPAMVKNAVKESSLSTLTVTTKAESRLGLETEFVRNQSIQRIRTLGGFATSTPSASIMLVAPVAGQIKVKANTNKQRVTENETVLEILPLLRPEQFINRPAEQIQWRDWLTTAKATLIEIEEQIKAAEIALNRAKQLFENKVGSARLLEESQARLAILNAKKKTIVARIENLKSGLQTKMQTFLSKAIPIQSPCSGFMTKMSVRNNQIVSAGTPLLSILDTTKLWIQVPVYVGDLNSFDLSKPVWIGNSEKSEQLVQVNPIAGLPVANAVANTVSLFFELNNTDDKFRPNQRIWIQLPLFERIDYLTIPYSSVLYDMHGNTWVYQKLGANKYVRRKIDMLFKFQSKAVLNRGLKSGMEVVVTGAPELFGSEFWYR